MAKTNRIATEHEGMDAIALIRSDHSRITSRLRELVDGEGLPLAQQRSLFDDLAALLAAHEFMEEETFYPAVRRHQEGEEVILRSIEQHHVVDELVESMKALSPADHQKWRTTADEIKAGVQGHIEFEQDAVLPLARRLLQDEELRTLGETMWRQLRSRLGDKEGQEHGMSASRHASRRGSAGPAPRKGPTHAARPSAKHARRP